MSKSPDAFRTISEVAEWLGVQAHVLRFWESKFTQVKPIKRAGGRRYYRPADMLLLGGIRKLLHDDGMSIKDVQAILRDLGIAHVSEMSHSLDSASPGEQAGSGGGHQKTQWSEDTSSATAPTTSEPQQAETDVPSDTPAFFHQDDLASTPSSAPQDPAPAPESPAPHADMTPPEATVPLDEAEPQPDPQAEDTEDTVADTGLETQPQAAESPVESDSEGAKTAPAEETAEQVVEEKPASTEPEQIMMDLGGPETDPATEPDLPPATEDLPIAETAPLEQPLADTGEVEAVEDPLPAPEPGEEDSPVPMETGLSPDPAQEDIPAQIDPAPAPAAESASPEMLPADEQTDAAAEPITEPDTEADADLAWQNAMDADAAVAEEGETDLSAEPVAPDPAHGDQGALSTDIEPTFEDADAPEDSDASGPALAAMDSAPTSKPRIIAVADEDLAAQVSLRPGLLALLAQTTEIPPQAQSDVAACAAELRAWLETH